MRKSAVAILIFAAILISYFFLKDPATAPSSGEQKKEIVSENAPQTAPPRPRWSKPNRTEPAQEIEADAKTSAAIVYGPSDFARGELQNVVVDGGIKLGNNESFVPRFNPKYRMFGNFISPEEEIKEPFDSVNVNFQVADLNNNEVTFEIRTRATDGFWTEWREVSLEQMKEPLSTGMQSSSWQYRLTLFANDSASSPKVEAVAIQPMRTKNYSANNSN